MLVTKQNFDIYEWSKVQKFEEKDIGHDSGLKNMLVE